MECVYEPSAAEVLLSESLELLLCTTTPSGVLLCLVVAIDVDEGGFREFNRRLMNGFEPSKPQQIQEKVPSCAEVGRILERGLWTLRTGDNGIPLLQ